MTDKEFKRLSRAQLIDIIYQFQLQIDKLTEQNQELEQELEDKRIRLSNAGNIADAIHQAQQNQTETEADTEHPDFWTSQYGTAAGKEHQEHSSNTLREIFSHNLNVFNNVKIISNCSKLFYTFLISLFQHFRGKIFESFPLFISRVDIYTPSSSRQIS